MSNYLVAMEAAWLVRDVEDIDDAIGVAVSEAGKRLNQKDKEYVDELIELNVQIRRQLPGWQELPITRSTAFYAGTYIALRRADTVRVRVPACEWFMHTREAWGSFPPHIG